MVAISMDTAGLCLTYFANRTQESGMATAAQAQSAFVRTREYFRNGVKSSNKVYFRTSFDLVREATLAYGAGIGMNAAAERIQRRDANLEISEVQQRGALFGGMTPVMAGSIWYNRGSTAGNCGMMAAVAMLLAQQGGVAETDMWYVTVKNRNHLSESGAPMTFEHTYAELGTVQDAGGPFIVDPWAGIVCPLGEYPDLLKAKLQKWHSQGKRITVTWGGATPKGLWMNANDAAILSLLGADRQRTPIRGDELLPL